MMALVANYAQYAYKMKEKFPAEDHNTALKVIIMINKLPSLVWILLINSQIQSYLFLNCTVS